MLSLRLSVGEGIDSPSVRLHASFLALTFRTSQVTRLNLCALEVFLRRRTKSGDADKTPPPVDLSSVLVGSDLPVAFPEAHVRRGRAGGVLPSKDMPK